MKSLTIEGFPRDKKLRFNYLDPEMTTTITLKNLKMRAFHSSHPHPVNYLNLEVKRCIEVTTAVKGF